MNYYEILGVERSATDEEIKRSYRKLAAKYHPDRTGGDTAKFQEIQQAYDNLSDPQKRASYDNPHPQFNHGGGFGGPSFHFGHGHSINDIFDRMFRQQASHIFRTTMWITLEQVLTGAEENIKLNIDNEQRYIKVQVPRGVLDGAQFKLDGVIPNASLLVEFKTHQHLKFQRNGANLQYKEKISVLKLITGTDIQLTTLAGTTIEVKVPPFTQPNTILKISGAGLPYMNSPQVGDLHVLLDPYVPTNIPHQIIDVISKVN